MSYPGLRTDIKSHLWKTVCCPTLLNGMEVVSLSKIQFKNVSRCVEIINNCRINLWRRIFKVDAPLRNLCCYFAARYIGHGDVFPQTLAANIINMGAPLMLNAFNCKHHRQNVVNDDGVVDTLRVLVHSHDYNLRHTKPHTLVTLLTRFEDIYYANSILYFSVFVV